jgi:hypothetical protein
MAMTATLRRRYGALRLDVGDRETSERPETPLPVRLVDEDVRPVFRCCDIIAQGVPAVRSARFQAVRSRRFAK